MPEWLINLVLPFIVKFITSYGVPAIEAKFPVLIPLIEAVMQFFKTQEPHPALESAAEHFNSCVAMSPALVGE